MAKIVLKGDATGQIELTAPSTAGVNIAMLPASTGTLLISSVTMNFPATLGATGQVLETDGLGNLSWVTPTLSAPQSANTVFAGPISGPVATPSFRSLEFGDMDAAFSASQSLSSNGYQSLPGGVVMQWGSDATDGLGVALITLPVPFPANYSLTVTAHDNVGNNVSVVINKSSNSQFTVTTETGSTGVALGFVDFDWIAIGY